MHRNRNEKNNLIPRNRSEYAEKKENRPEAGEGNIEGRVPETYLRSKEREVSTKAASYAAAKQLEIDSGRLQQEIRRGHSENELAGELEAHQEQPPTARRPTSQVTSILIVLYLLSKIII